MEDNKPYWWPERTDENWCNRIREDYPEDTEDMDDEEIRDRYADGREYADVWDHLGDARHDYRKLAEAFLRLVTETGKNPSDFT